DHLRIVALVEAAAEFALRHLAPGGAFVAKVFEGGTEQALLARLKRSFAGVRHIKPPASRKESAEIYLVATGFRGLAPMPLTGRSPCTRSAATGTDAGNRCESAPRRRSSGTREIHPRTASCKLEPIAEDGFAAAPRHRARRRQRGRARRR